MKPKLNSLEKFDKSKLVFKILCWINFGQNNHKTLEEKRCKKLEVWNQISSKVSLSSWSTLKKLELEIWMTHDCECLFFFFWEEDENQYTNALYRKMGEWIYKLKF